MDSFNTLAKLSLRRPRSALAACLAIGAALALIGLGVSSALSPSIGVVPGTESSRAQALATSQFGPSQLVPILLEGPKASLDRQGPPLNRPGSPAENGPRPRWQEALALG